jgi:hypothetical protein
MKKAVIATLIILLIILFIFYKPSAAVKRPVCPRGYYYRPGPNSFAGWKRECIPIGEASSEDAIPAIYTN